MTDWRTIGERNASTGMYETLHESVPSWLLDSMTAWVTPYFDWSGGNDLEGLRLFERRIRRQIEGSTGHAKWGAVSSAFPSEPDILLELIDFQLHRMSAEEPYDRDNVAALDAMLAQGGSAWTIAEREGAYALEQRLAAATITAASTAMAGAGRAGDHLEIAWTKAFGRNPDPSAAYREAVRAVETAAIPVISPNNERATLGTMIANLRDAPQRYEVAIYTDDEGVQRLQATLELLWKGQHDRHGTDDDEAPIHVDQPAAEAAVHLAVTLVEWFRSGTVARRGASRTRDEA